MKKRVRTISVNGQKFAWWCLIKEHETVVKLSPLEDKNFRDQRFLSRGKYQGWREPIY